MKLSARNQFKGTIADIQEGAVNAIVKIDIGGGNIVSSVITMSSVRELGLKVGGTAYEPAVIRLHLDREELTAGEPATVSYEIIGLENLSTLSAYTVLTPEGGTFDDRIYESCDIIPAASGTFEVTPSGEGTLYLGLSVDGTNGYYIGAYMTDIPVRAQAQETR